MIGHLKGLAIVSGLVALLALAPAPGAQSNDERSPIALDSGEIQGRIVAGTPQDDWFTFVAGPGELAVVAISKKNARDNGAVGVTCKLYDENTRQVISVLAQDGMDEVKRTAVLSKSARIKLHLETYDNGSPSGGSYRISISGAVDFADSSAARNGPKGRLRIELIDGGVQEFELAKIRRITVDP